MSKKVSTEGCTPAVDGLKSNGSTADYLAQSKMIRSNIHNIATLLNTGLNAESLDICIKLIEAGVHPQALADVLKQIRDEVSGLNHPPHRN